MSDVFYTLGELCIPQPKSNIKAGEGLTTGKHKFFTSSNIQNKFYNKYQFDKPALIFGTGGNASIHYCDEPFATSTDCIVLYAKNESIGLKAIYRYLEGNMHLLEDGFRGAGLKHISKTYLLNIAINSKIFEDQDNAVEVLDQLNILIEKRKQQVEKFDLLVKSRFIEMFGDFDSGTHKYGTQRLGNLSFKISDGVHLKPEYVEFGKPFISVQNISRGVIDFTDCKFVTEEAYQKMIKSTYPEKGDVLYTKVGTYGIPAYVDTDRKFCLYVSVCLIKPNPLLINPRFLSISMGMTYVKKQADKRIKGIGVPDLHLNQIREFDIIVPPMDIQNRFVAFVAQIDKIKSTIMYSLKKLETLKKALVQKYFG